MIQTISEWLKSAPKNELKKIEWIVSHAGRGLIKQGHPKMLQLIGVNSKAKIAINKIILSKSKLNIGETLTITVELKNNSKKTDYFILDYKVDYYRPSGKFSSKVFKGKKNQIAGSATLVVTLNLAFKDISTRKIFAGPHRVTPLLNGNESPAKSFNIS